MAVKRNRKRAGISMPPPNEAFTALGGLRGLRVEQPNSRLGRSLFAHADPERDALDFQITMIDPIRLQQLCDADPQLQSLLKAAIAAKLGDRAMQRVEKRLRAVFVRKLLVEIIDHFDDIRDTIATALVVREHERQEAEA